ncbi:hypothetical protein [Halorientalis halophila]|uniref:hypothetical protein n=1 Tax=Halorientalis halophila TaxID=3108499 RepID=UPI00300B7A7F
MDETDGRPAEGQRVQTRLDGQTVAGTVESVTYTPRKGHLIARVSLDDRAPSGQSAVAVAVEDLETVD